MPATTAPLTGDDAALQRAAARNALRSAAAMCWDLHRLLPHDEPWRGPASVAYRLRVAELRERIDAACAVLSAAEAAL